MNEEEKVEFYKKNRGQDIWGEPDVSREAPSERLDSIVSIRFSPREVSLLRAQAKVRGVSLSQFVRSVSLRDAEEQSSVQYNLIQLVSRKIETSFSINIKDFSGASHSRPGIATSALS